MSVERIYYDKMQKLESKLKNMEISFEQINNSRNDLIKQLAVCEMLNESFKEKLYMIGEFVSLPDTHIEARIKAIVNMDETT